MRYHHHQETQRHNLVRRSMSKEARRLTALIANLRKSTVDIEKERARTTSDPAIGILDRRRNNLMATITALEDRLGAVQGLLQLGRPYVGHRTH
jgi:hypothetical protein